MLPIGRTAHILTVNPSLENEYLHYSNFSEALKIIEIVER